MASPIVAAMPGGGRDEGRNRVEGGRKLKQEREERKSDAEGNLRKIEGPCMSALRSTYAQARGPIEAAYADWQGAKSVYAV